jgi:hypothetical protein
MRESAGAEDGGRTHHGGVPRRNQGKFASFRVVLSEKRKLAIKQEAASRARALDDDLLRAETLRLTLEENDAPPGDAREELHVRCWAYAFEMGERKLKER